MNFFKDRKHKCADNSTVYVKRNPMDAFPLALHDVSSKVAAKLQGGEVTASHKKDIAELLVKIDGANSSLQLKFVSLYNVYATDPCDPENKKWLKQEVQKANEAATILSYLSMAIAGNGDVEVVNKALIEAKRVFGENSAVDEARESFRPAAANVDAWSEHK